MIVLKIAVHFGAGNIGRGFIGMLLAQAGYRVIFVDVATELVQAIQECGSYTVEIAGETLKSVTVEGVEARLSDDPELPAILASAELITTAVGAKVLGHVAKSIAASLGQRSSSSPQYIIACENMIRGSSMLRQAVLEQLGGAVPTEVFFLDAAVDRVVPLLSHDNILTVRVEQYHEWLVEGSAEQSPQLAQIVAQIAALHLVPNLAPFLKRKIYTVNTGHACAAWHGFRLGYGSVNQALTDQTVYQLVSQALAESSAGLCSEYACEYSWGWEEQQAYCHKVLERFQNPFIIDDVLRVGRQPLRKLGMEERIDGPLKLAEKHGHAVDYLLRGAAAALLFRNEQDPEACELQQSLEEKGLERFLNENLAHFSSDNLLKIRQYYLEGF